MCAERLYAWNWCVLDYEKTIKKEITFIYTGKLEHQSAEPIAQETEKRDYKVKFSDNI